MTEEELKIVDDATDFVMEAELNEFEEREKG